MASLRHAASNCMPHWELRREICNGFGVIPLFHVK
jgi:hypothetical protein